MLSYFPDSQTSREVKMCLSVMHTKVLVDKHISDSFPIQNGLEQGDALLSLLFNFAFECTIRKVQENQMGLKLNGTPELLAFADDVKPTGR
jgi:hypothetical protein